MWCEGRNLSGWHIKKGEGGQYRRQGWPRGKNEPRTGQEIVILDRPLHLRN